MKMTRDELWSKGYTYGGGFYIHLHQKDIGAMLTHKPASIDSLTRSFQNQKRKAKQALQTQYRELFVENITEEDKDNLSELFKDNGNLEKVDQALKQFFEESLNSDSARRIIENQKKVQWGDDSTNLKKALKASSNVWKGFDSLLTALANSVRIINQQDGKTVAAILRHARKKKTIGEVGSYLQNALNQVKIEDTTIQGENLQKTVIALKKISKKMATGDKSGKQKRIEGIKKVILLLLNI